MKKFVKILMIIAFTCSSFIGLSCCSNNMVSEDSEAEQVMPDDAGRSIESSAHCGSL